MGSRLGLRRPRSRRKSVVLTAVAVFALAVVATAAADTTTPATVTLGANATANVSGAFKAPATYLDPATDCPHQTDDPGQTIPNCVHTRFTANVAAGSTTSTTIRATYDPNDVWVDITVKIEDPTTDVDIVVTQGLAEGCGPGCAEATFDANGQQPYDVIFSPAFFFTSCPPGSPVDAMNPLGPKCPNVPFSARFTTGACVGNCGMGTGGGIDPPIYVSNSTLVEGDSGVKNATFTVTMGATSLLPVTVNYATDDGTATAGSDYVPTAGTVVFAPGETVKTISVPVLGEMAREQNESFNVYLSLPQPVRVGSIGDGQGIGRVTNDDWGRSMTGYGRLLAGNGAMALRLYEYWGYYSIQYYESSSFNFRASQIASVTWNDLTHSVRITGSGWNAGHAATFTLDVTDVGATDTVALTLSDGAHAGGLLASGNFTYAG
jgi:hypothetical protein